LEDGESIDARFENELVIDFSNLWEKNLFHY